MSTIGFIAEKIKVKCKVDNQTVGHSNVQKCFIYSMNPKFNCDAFY